MWFAERTEQLGGLVHALSHPVLELVAERIYPQGVPVLVFLFHGHGVGMAGRMGDLVGRGLVVYGNWVRKFSSMAVFQARVKRSGRGHSAFLLPCS